MKNAFPANTDPVVGALVVLYRRFPWLVVAAVIGGIAAYLLAAPGAPRHVADAQLYLKQRPIVSGGLQDPVNVVAYRALLLSPAMQAAAGGAGLEADIEVTQDTNFGKHYSPVITLRASASSAKEAASAIVAWREAFLKSYGDLGSQPSQSALVSLEKRGKELEESVRAALLAEYAAEAQLRPLLLARADLERLLAPFTLEIDEPAAAKPRAVVQTRERVVAQDVTLESSPLDAPKVQPAGPESLGYFGLAAQRALKELGSDHKRLTGAQELPEPKIDARTEAAQQVVEEQLLKLSVPLAEARAAHRLAQDARVRLQAESNEVQRAAEMHRMLLAGAVGNAPGEPGANAASEFPEVNAFQAADVIWLAGPSEPRLVVAGRSKVLPVAGALAGAILAAAWLLLASVAASQPLGDRKRS